MDILLGFGVSNVGFPGMKPFSIANIAFSNPEMPAAGSECPTLLLICFDYVQSVRVIINPPSV